MNIITIKEYARQKNVTYEAVRKQITRYSAELEGHIIKDGRQQLLDEEAVSFLDNKRAKNPVVYHQQAKDEKIEELEQENKNLLIKIAAQADKIASQADELRSNDKALLEYNTLLLTAQEDKKRVEEAESKANDLEDELKALREALKASEEQTATIVTELNNERDKKYSFKEWWKGKRK